VEADRRRALAVLDQPTAQPTQRMTQDQISDLVSRLGDIMAALREADPADRFEVYQQLGLRLTYHPTEQKVRVQAQPDADSHGKMVGVRGGTRPRIHSTAAGKRCACVDRSRPGPW
jgi:site-specific DNA recombinase